MVVARKSDSSLRVCLDPRYINPHIRRKNFALPKTDELLATLDGAQYYTVADADAAFWQLPLDQSSSELCCFATQWGNYQWLRLPFGIIDASERFSEAMHSLFADVPGVLNCVDDFLIYGRTKSEHDANLERFLQRCREVGLKLKASKLQYCRNSVKFLGHQVSSNGVAILPSRVKDIDALPRPKDVREV